MSFSADRRREVGAEALAAAMGRHHRDDPVAPRTGGPAGNARLTAWTGLVLLVLAAAELVTLLNVGTLISWHVVIGTLLIPPALLKTASTGWRIVRYYGGNPAYRQAGPPPLLLRVLGPGVVVSTLALLGSGIVLVLLGQARSRTVIVTAIGQRVDWLTVHQGLFIVWAVLAGLHVLARTVPAAQLTVLARRVDRPVDGTVKRTAVLAGCLAIAAAAAFLVVSAAGSWRHGSHQRPPGPRGIGVHTHR